MNDQQNSKQTKKAFTPFVRAIVEVGSIVFLFYTNLLMGEFTHSGLGHNRGLWWAVQDIFTVANLAIAIVFALIGYLFFEFCRNRL
jgi:hypothetical protein